MATVYEVPAWVIDEQRRVWQNVGYTTARCGYWFERADDIDLHRWFIGLDALLHQRCGENENGTEKWYRDPRDMLPEELRVHPLL